MARGRKKPGEKPDWWLFLGLGDDGWSSTFKSVDLLLRHLARKHKSVASRRAYCYNLWKIYSELKVNPDELVSRARENPDEVAQSVQKIADRKMASPRYANHIIAVAKTFFEVNKVDLLLEGYEQPVRFRKRPEYVPSFEEALRMADVAGSLRNRLVIKFFTYTGLRSSTFRAQVYNETYPADPLLQEYTIKKQLERGEECLAIIVHEVMKKRDPNACKNKIFYYTFIPPKATRDLRLYLKEIREKYGPILDDQPVFITEDRWITFEERRKTSISARELQEVVKNAARKAGIKNWKHVYPHCLRKTYESFLRNQPDNVRLDVKDREFLFGHTMPGSQDTYYDKTKIEEMRAKYSKMIFEPVSIKTEERVVSEDELQTFLQQGWRFVATLLSGKVVVSREVKVERPEDAKTASVQTSSAMVQKGETQSNPKMRISESFAPPTPSMEAHDSPEGNTACATESRQPCSPELTNPSTIAIPQHDPQNSLSVMQSTNTREEKDAQGSITKYRQKTLLDFNS